MDHGDSDGVKEQSQMEMTIKTEVEAAAKSTVLIEIEIDLNHLKQEPGLVQSIKSEPTLLMNEEVLEDSSQGASTLAGPKRVNEGCDMSFGDLRNVKQEPGDMDIGPIVLQHMDIHYAINKDEQNAGQSEMPPPCAERLLHDTQSSNSNQRLRVDSNGAIRNKTYQRYRDKHREEINQRRRDTRLKQRSLQPIASSSNIHSKQPIEHDEVARKRVEIKATLRRERARRYWERHREEINQRRRESRRRKQNVQHK